MLLKVMWLGIAVWGVKYGSTLTYMGLAYIIKLLKTLAASGPDGLDAVIHSGGGDRGCMRVVWVTVRHCATCSRRWGPVVGSR